MQFARCFSAALVASLVATSATSADELTDTIGKVLEKPILSKDQSTAEVRAFIEPRIAPMPAITTREQWQQDAERYRQQALTKVVLRG